MMHAMEMTATVAPTDETKKINDWSTSCCNGAACRTHGHEDRLQVWASEDVEIDQDSFQEMTRALASLQPGAAAAAEELLKIDGVPVLVESRDQGMGGSTTDPEEMVSAATEAAPAGTYEVPEGYTEQEFNPMGQGGPGR